MKNNKIHYAGAIIASLLAVGSVHAAVTSTTNPNANFITGSTEISGTLSFSIANPFTPLIQSRENPASWNNSTFRLFPHYLGFSSQYGSTTTDTVLYSDGGGSQQSEALVDGTYQYRSSGWDTSMLSSSFSRDYAQGYEGSYGILDPSGLSTYAYSEFYDGSMPYRNLSSFIFLTRDQNYEGCGFFAADDINFEANLHSSYTFYTTKRPWLGGSNLGRDESRQTPLMRIGGVEDSLSLYNPATNPTVPSIVLNPITSTVSAKTIQLGGGNRIATNSTTGQVEITNVTSGGASSGVLTVGAPPVGAAAPTGQLTVNGNATVTGALSTTGQLTTGQLTVNGDATVTGLLTVQPKGGISMGVFGQ